MTARKILGPEYTVDLVEMDFRLDEPKHSEYVVDEKKKCEVMTEFYKQIKDGDQQAIYEAHLQYMVDHGYLTPEEKADRQLLKEQVRGVLSVLSDREREVLEMRFGLKDGQDHTLEEVGKHFGVTRERIRQIEAKALRKLRHPTRSRQLRDYLS